MTRPIFSLPFIGLIVKVILFGATAALVVVSAISYITYTSLDTSLDTMRQSNADSRVALALLETKVDCARTRVNELLETERELRDEAEKLKEDALRLERDWEVVKMYKRRIDESGREIEEIRLRIRGLGR